MSIVVESEGGKLEPTITANGKAIGRPRKQVDLEMVEELAGIGCTLEEIATICKIHVKTLNHPRFLAVLEKGRAACRTSLRRAQLKAALSGNVVAQIWLGKNLLGQRDRFPDEKAQEDTYAAAPAPDPNAPDVEPARAVAPPVEPGEVDKVDGGSQG